MSVLSIGQLAKAAQVNLETIRYYERRGLLPEPPRNQSGHRQYPIAALVRTIFIKKAQSLGFSLVEIEELLSLRVAIGSTCGDVKHRVQTKIDEVDRKISELQRIRGALDVLAERCTGMGPVGQCPILEALDTQTKKEIAK